MSFAAGAFSANIAGGHCGAQRRQFSVLNKNALSAVAASAAAAATPGGGVTPSPAVGASSGSTSGAPSDPRVQFAKQHSVIGGQLVDIQTAATAVAIDGAGIPKTG